MKNAFLSKNLHFPSQTVWVSLMKSIRIQNVIRLIMVTWKGYVFIFNRSCLWSVCSPSLDGNIKSSSGHSWSISQWSRAGQSSRPTALCLNEYQSSLPGWATTPPTPRGCDWSRGDQPARGRRKPLYQCPFTDNNDAKQLMSPVRAEVSSSLHSQISFGHDQQPTEGQTLDQGI